MWKLMVKLKLDPTIKLGVMLISIFQAPLLQPQVGFLVLLQIKHFPLNFLVLLFLFSASFVFLSLLWNFTICSIKHALKTTKRVSYLFFDNSLSFSTISFKTRSSTPISLFICLRQFMNCFQDCTNFPKITAT